MNKLLTILIISFATILPVSAMKVRVLAWDQKIAKRKFSVAEGKKHTEIKDMHQFARTKPIEIKGKQKLNLVADDMLDSEGKPLMLPLRVGEGITNPLVLILPNPESPIGVRALVFEDNIDGFAWGSFRFINLTKENLVFRYGQEKKVIPKGWKPSTFAPAKNKRMPVAFYSRSGQKANPEYTGIWESKIGQRKLVFIVPSKDKSRGKIDFKIIVQNKATLDAENKIEEEISSL